MHKQTINNHSFPKLCSNHLPSKWTTGHCLSVPRTPTGSGNEISGTMCERNNDWWYVWSTCLSVCPDRMTDLTEGLVRCRGRNGLWVGRGGIQVFPTDIMTAFQCVTSSHERCGLPSYSSIQIPTPAKPSSPLPFIFLLPLLILLYMYLHTNTRILTVAT